LTDSESDHLHALAGTAPVKSGLHRRDVRPSIRALLDRVPQTAGIVISAAFEVLAWNELATSLMEDFAALAPRDRNLARRAFLDTAQSDAPLYGISDDLEFRHSVVKELRSTLTRYPTDPLVIELIGELREASSAFDRLWQRHEVAAPPALRKTFRHTRVGEITVDCDSMRLTEADQHLILYTASPGSADADKLALLGLIGAQAIDAEDRSN
jgi:hypothetical protein